MPGILQSSLTNPNDPSVVPGSINNTQVPAIGAATYTPTKLPDPTTWTVTPDQTVAGQITRLTDPNNPIIQQARSRSNQAMNSRGLLNSSIASTAADSAAYDVALPIAQADAANASKVAGYNANRKDEFAAKNQDTSTQTGLANTGQINQLAQTNLTTATQKSIADLIAS